MEPKNSVNHGATTFNDLERAALALARRLTRTLLQKHLEEVERELHGVAAQGPQGGGLAEVCFGSWRIMAECIV